MILQILGTLTLLVGAIICAPGQMMRLAREDKPPQQDNGQPTRTLDKIGGGNLNGRLDLYTEGQILRALDRERNDNKDRDSKPKERPRPSSSGTLDSIGGGNLIGLVDPYPEQRVVRSADRDHLLDSLDSFKGGEVLRMLDSITGGDLLASLDSSEAEAVLSTLRKAHTRYPKRMLDSVSGWAFGESKRNFDEIDNVGFTGFAKRGPYYRSSLALAKKNFDEIDRAGFGTYQKRNFDEIDNTGMGFGAYAKRDLKE